VYRLEQGAYRKVALDRQGRAWLEPVGLWLGVTVNPETGGDRLALIDPATGREIGDYTAISRALRESEARAKAEAERANTEAERANAEAERANAEAQARAEAEARLRELEDELRRLRRGTTT
jgi:hypothetical protein